VGVKGYATGCTGEKLQRMSLDVKTFISEKKVGNVKKNNANAPNCGS